MDVKLSAIGLGSFVTCIHGLLAMTNKDTTENRDLKACRDAQAGRGETPRVVRGAGVGAD